MEKLSLWESNEFKKNTSYTNILLTIKEVFEVFNKKGKFILIVVGQDHKDRKEKRLYIYENEVKRQNHRFTDISKLKEGQTYQLALEINKKKKIT